jgi:hypothetical protein
VAQQLRINLPTGSAVYALLISRSSGQYALAAGGRTEPVDPAHLASYAVPLAEEVAGNGRYVGDVPSGLPADSYLIEYYVRIGANPAWSDGPSIGSDVFEWDGTGVVKLAALVAGTGPTGTVLPPAVSTLLAVGSSVLHPPSATGATAWFSFIAPTSRSYLISITGVGQRTGAALQLYGGVGPLLVGAVGAQPSVDPALTLRLVPGNYYFCVIAGARALPAYRAGVQPA